MTDYNLDSIKEELTNQIGEKVLYLWEIRKIVNNLGADYIEGTIRNHLKNCKINPEDYGINAGFFLYPQNKVWDYLKSLEQKGKIQLAKRNIDSFEEIIDREYHKVDLDTVRGREGRRLSGHLPIDEASGSWDNTIRVYED